MGRGKGLASSAEAEDAIGDDAETTEHHQRSCYHGIEEIAGEGLEEACSYGDGDEVVDEGPEEVLMDRT